MFFNIQICFHTSIRRRGQSTTYRIQVHALIAEMCPLLHAPDLVSLTQVTFSDFWTQSKACRCLQIQQ
jgi:hypothetical protein